jgi:rod shape-determining protein MreC
MRLLLSKKVVLLLATFILVIFLLNLYQNQVRNFFYLVSEPIQKTLWGARKAQMEEENVKLRLQVQELLSETGRLFELERENKVLREALGLGLQREFNLILSQVTGKNIAEDSLIINKGAKAGVKNDTPVITQQKVLIGKIDEVFENFSRIQLISNKKSSFDARVLGREVQGLVKGGGNFKISFDLVPQYEEVKEGELITTTALGGIFPAGLLVGQIKGVKKSDIEPFQQIEISPAFDIKQLDYLFIIND